MNESDGLCSPRIVHYKHGFIINRALLVGLRDVHPPLGLFYNNPMFYVHYFSSIFPSAKGYFYHLLFSNKIYPFDSLLSCLFNEPKLHNSNLIWRSYDPFIQWVVVQLQVRSEFKVCTSKRCLQKHCNLFNFEQFNETD